MSPGTARAWQETAGTGLKRLLRLWKERQTYYSALKALPGTICHHDAGHRNIFALRNETGVEQTLLIDWELVGYGALGEELGNLFAPALINFEVEPARAEEFASSTLPIKPTKFSRHPIDLPSGHFFCLCALYANLQA